VQALAGELLEEGVDLARLRRDLPGLQDSPLSSRGEIVICRACWSIPRYNLVGAPDGRCRLPCYPGVRPVPAVLLKEKRAAGSRLGRKRPDIRKKGNP
jgi:hypothetical protein